MAPLTIDRQLRRDSLPRRCRCRFLRGSLDQLQPARLVELGGFCFGVGRRLRNTADDITGLELVLLLGSFADGDQEFAITLAKSALDEENVAQVAVVPLIKRPQQLDSGLHRQESSLPRYFFRHLDVPTVL